MPKRPSAFPTQNFVKIKTIKDGVIKLKDGTLVVVLMVSSVNFALKSQDEQDALIYRFQEFLNLIDFPIQIVISSRKINLNDYLQSLKDQEKKQDSELMRMQIAEYHDFVKALLQVSNIVQKSFYIAVSYSPLEQGGAAGLKNIFASLGGVFKKDSKTAKEAEVASEPKGQLFQRVEHVVSGLRLMGLRAVPLRTQELIELFYNLYNPRPEVKKGFANANELNVTNT